MSNLEVTASDLLLGLERAMQRLETDLETWDHPELSLFECLNWVVSLQDRLRNRDGTEHPDRALVDIDAFVFSGLRWVRNAVHHDWSRAIRLEPVFPIADGAVPPRTNPGRMANLLAGGWSYRWIPADEIDPLPPGVTPKQHVWNQRMDYEGFVRLTDVRASIVVAHSFAASFAERLDSTK